MWVLTVLALIGCALVFLAMWLEDQTKERKSEQRGPR